MSFAMATCEGSVFSWLKRKPESPESQRGIVLYDAVRKALERDADGREVDEATVRIVGSIAALLLCVAYADLDYAPEEERVLRQTLGGMQGLDAFGVEAIATVLREHTVVITSAEATSYARELLELTAIDLRQQLLDVLVDVAGADGVITVSETNMLRPVARALGLSQQQYNVSQARHRDKLAVLKQ